MKYIGRDSSGEIYDTEEKIKDYIREMTTLGDVREYFDNSGDYTLSVEKEGPYGEYRVADEDFSITTWMEYFERYINEIYEIGDWGLDKCRVFKKLTISNAKATIEKLGKPSIIRLDDIEGCSMELTVEDVFLTEKEFDSYNKCQGTLNVRGYFTGFVLIDEETFTQSLEQRYNLKAIFASEYFTQAVENDLLFRVAFETWRNREDEKE